MITLTIWHNVATDAQGRHAGMLDGYQPGNPMVLVFAYQADPAGRSPEAIAEEAFGSATATPATPAARTCPAGITTASCGRCPSATSCPSAKSRSPSDVPAGPRSAAA